MRTHPDDAAQLNIIEAIMVGAIVFTAVAATAVFRLPTSPASFQQAELERIGADALHALLAKAPDEYGTDAARLKNCNVDDDDDGTNDDDPCPYANELERLVSLAMNFRNNGPSGVANTDPIADFFDQALPEGSFYVIYFSNGAGARALYPTFREPPAADVVVAHGFMGPPWLDEAVGESGSTGSGKEAFYLRLGEVTDFDPALVAGDPMNAIYDPLGRTVDEDDADGTGETIESRFALAQTGQDMQKVPLHMPLGTYRLDLGAANTRYIPDADDRYFAVVPPGVAGPGALVYPADLDDGLSDSYMDFYGVPVDTVRVGHFGDLLYLDLDVGTPGDNKVSTGDLRLFSYEGLPPGSFVDPGDADEVAGDTLSVPPALGVAYSHANVTTPTQLDDGEAVYLDAASDYQKVSIGDWRLSRAGIYPMGSRVAAGDQDIGRDLSANLNGPRFRWVDGGTGGVNQLTEGDTVYMDLSGEELAQGVGVFDIHVTARGAATLRYLYDIRLVVWFGV